MCICYPGAGLGLAWVFVPGWIATTISSIIAISGVVIGLLQWLHPIQIDQTPPLQEPIEQRSQLVRVTSPLQEAILSPPLTKKPPFDEELLIRPRRLVGRKDDLKWLLERLRGGGRSVTALCGIGGIGKTALVAVAIHILHTEKYFRDGIVVISCQNLKDATEIVWRVLTRFDPQYQQSQVMALEDLISIAPRILKGKKILIVLDNVEPDLLVGQVLAPLLAAETTLLLTARHVLPTIIVPAKDTRRLSPLQTNDAVDLFAQPFGLDSDRQLTTNERNAIERIVAMLDKHTLTIKLAGAYALECHRDLRALADELGDPQHMIEAFDTQISSAMEHIFVKSIEHLPYPAKRLFTVLAIFPTSEFGRQATLALATSIGLDAPGNSIDLLVRQALLDASVLDSLPEGCDYERLRLHPILRAYALSMLSQEWTEAEKESSYRALAMYYSHYITRVPEAGLVTDEDNIMGILEWTREHREDESFISLCFGMRTFWYEQGRATASLRHLQWAVELTTPSLEKEPISSDRILAAEFALAYGRVLDVIGKPADAEQFYKRNLAIRRELADRQGEGKVLRYLGRLMQAREGLNDAENYYQQALIMAREGQNPRDEIEVLRWLGEVAQDRGNLDESERYYQQALQVAYREKYHREEGEVLRSLGEFVWWRGQTQAAEAYFLQALTIAHRVYNRREVGWLLASLGGVTLRKGNLDKAEAYIQNA